MEAATTPQPPVNAEEHAERVVADAEKRTEELFRWSQWVHIGEGAEECDERHTGKCDKDEHFHAWCRLPNPFQVRDIVEKSRAAKARRLRLLRDADSDPRVVMENELEELKEVDQDILADEILDTDFSQDYVAAQREVNSRDDPDYVPKDEEDIPKQYEDIDQDREEYERQSQLPEDQRGDDYDVLEKTLSSYSEAIEEEMKKIQQPKRDGLMAREKEDLIDILRRERMEKEGIEVYLHTFNTWQMYVCTLKPAGEKRPSERVWSDISVFKFQAPTEVILEVKAVFEDLEKAMAQDRLGKGS